MSTRREK